MGAMMGWCRCSWTVDYVARFDGGDAVEEDDLSV